jgi:hypothetical protein
MTCPEALTKAHSGRDLSLGTDKIVEEKKEEERL